MLISESLNVCLILADINVTHAKLKIYLFATLVMVIEIIMLLLALVHLTWWTEKMFLCVVQKIVQVVILTLMFA